MQLNLYSKPYLDTSDPVTEENSKVSIDFIDMWDESDWYVCVSNKWAEDARIIDIFVGKTSSTAVVEWKEVSVVVPRDNTAPAGNVSMTDTSLVHKLYVGDHAIAGVANQFSDSNGSINPGNYEYHGKLYGLKFWTTHITRDLAIEHCKNPLSIAAMNPQVQDPIPRYYQGQKVHEYSGLVDVALPSGGWERLRAAWTGLEELEDVATDGYIIDTTQNEYHLDIFGAKPEKRKIRYSTVSDLVTAGISENKIRVRSYEDEALARANGAYFGQLYELPTEVGLDDRRFSIESSIVHALNRDMINLLGNMDTFNEYLGAPEMEYAVEYPEIRRIRDLYFERLVQKMPYNSVIEFQRWFNNNFSALIEDFVPYTADFLGINFVIESHILERHKFEYKQGDVHVDLNDRLAISQVPIIMGTATNNIV
jgi:hypothetical protein